MQNRSYFQERLNRLGFGEALNVTFTTPDGNEIRKVKFNPRTARSLVEIPNNKGFVFNLKEGFEGLDNFLRLRGYDREKIRKIHQQLEKKEIRSPRRGRRTEDRDDASDLYQKYKDIAMSNLDTVNQFLREATPFIGHSEIKTQETQTPSVTITNSFWVIKIPPPELYQLLLSLHVDYTKYRQNLDQKMREDNQIDPEVKNFTFLPRSLDPLISKFSSLRNEYYNLNFVFNQENEFADKLSKEKDYVDLLDTTKKLMSDIFTPEEVDYLLKNSLITYN